MTVGNIKSSPFVLPPGNRAHSTSTHFLFFRRLIEQKIQESDVKERAASNDKMHIHYLCGIQPRILQPTFSKFCQAFDRQDYEMADKIISLEIMPCCPSNDLTLLFQCALGTTGVMKGMHSSRAPNESHLWQFKKAISTVEANPKLAPEIKAAVYCEYAEAFVLIGELLKAKEYFKKAQIVGGVSLELHQVVVKRLEVISANYVVYPTHNFSYQMKAYISKQFLSQS